MTEIVTGTPSVVGFTDGHNHHDYQRGWTDKDTMFASSIDAGERTRDILMGQRFEAEHMRDAICAVGVNVEKNGAAVNLAIEKVGAASILEVAKATAALGLNLEKTAAATNLNLEKTAAATNLNLEKMAAAQQLATERAAAAAALLATQNQAAALAQAAECCCELKALIASTESNRIRDELATLRTQFLILTGGGATPVTPAAFRAG